MKMKFFLASLATLGLSATAHAEQSFTGQIKAFGFSYCMKDTASAAGQLLSVSQNAALFSLYGTAFGGNGTTTFALPDLRGVRVVGTGTANGAPIGFNRGQVRGSEEVTLTYEQMPLHNHAFNASSEPNSADSTAGNTFATFTGVNAYADAGNNDVQMNPGIIGNTGSSTPIIIVSPLLTINYCVVLNGVYPPRPQ